MGMQEIGHYVGRVNGINDDGTVNVILSFDGKLKLDTGFSDKALYSGKYSPAPVKVVGYWRDK